ncbi:MAG: 50S ribosomal protein L10 [Nanoarchaeota archaeon]
MGKEKKVRIREKEIPEYKKNIVAEMASKIKGSKTTLIASTRKLPSSQFHTIKKNLRGRAEIKVARKSSIIRAIETVNRQGLDKIKESIHADVALFFSNLDAFELSALLTENQSPARAKAGDVALEDIKVEPGPTDLIPGPAISELSGVGLKVAVEGGKLAIKQSHTIVKAGDIIKANVASVLGKLNILPMKVGFEPLAAYDSTEDKVYVGIKINKEEALDGLRHAIGKARGFAINLAYVCKETISALIGKAGMHEKAIMKLTTTKEGA